MGLKALVGAIVALSLYGLRLCEVLETVQLPQGLLHGVVKQSRSGRSFHAFLGVPFAKPPVGDLRFQDPVPHSGWEGVLNATKDAPVCAQDMPYFPDFPDEIFGQEDCLYLNVYTPKLDSLAKLPVMVFIHGGGFLMGQASSYFYGPEYFMDHNVVLVVIQYRLGVLGFLSFGDALVPGNFGLKDQVLALHWVQKNIGLFGGDPGSVTIFGESAGAASVNFHLVSPLSQGLFHKAILQSGTASCTWALIPLWLARDRAHSVATLAGCPTQPTEKALACLKRMPAHVFVHIMDKFFIWARAPMIRFTPVIEPSCSLHNFLPHHPLKLPHSKVPVIMGVNFREGGIIAAPFCSDSFKLALQLNNDLETRLPLSLSTVNWLPAEKKAEFVEKLTNFYLNGDPVSEDNFDGFLDMVTDLAFAHPAVVTARYHRTYGPVYFYLYNYELPVSFNDMFGKCSRPLGVSHGDELYQLFPSDMFKYNLSDVETNVSNQILQLWTSFAKQGYPEHEEWTPVSTEEIDYLYISRNSMAKQRGLFTERMKFVETLPLKHNDAKRQKTEL